MQAAIASGAATPDLETEENSPSTSDREENGANGHANGETGNERSCTGILTSHPQSRDLQFEKFTLLFHGHMLLEDTNLELNYGRLMAPNFLTVLILQPGLTCIACICNACHSLDSLSYVASTYPLSFAFHLQYKAGQS